MKARRPRRTRRMGLSRGYAIGLSLLLVGGVIGLVIALTRGGPGPAIPQAIPATETQQAALAPDFSVRTSSGSVFTLSQHRGEPVVLFFMAPG